MYVMPDACTSGFLLFILMMRNSAPYWKKIAIGQLQAYNRWGVG